MPITNITELRKNLYNAVDSVIEYNEPIQITSKKGNAVLISEDDYNSLIETVYIMSNPGLVKKIKEGEKEDVKKMSKFNLDEEW